MGQVRCTNSYSGATQETKNFTPGWIPPTWIHGYNASIPATSRTGLERAFLYTASSEDVYAFRGKMATYPGGGYVADLTDNAHAARSLVHELAAKRWVDQYTRAVLVEFNILNVNSKLFNQVILVFEYLTDGTTLWSTSVNVVQLYRYSGAAGVLALLSEIGCAIFVLVITIVEVMISTVHTSLKHVPHFIKARSTLH